MASDNQYTALGPAVVGFQTDGTEIEFGAQITGTNCGADCTGEVGVKGTGINGVMGFGRGDSCVGVWGQAEVGVRGDGAGNGIGVSGYGTTAVQGNGIVSPVDGSPGVGVEGICYDESTGVRGKAMGSGYGGEFWSTRLAQIHLEPLLMEDPNGRLPGKGGDIVAIHLTDPALEYSLWFCKQTGTKTTAVWAKIA